MITFSGLAMAAITPMSQVKCLAIGSSTVGRLVVLIDNLEEVRNQLATSCEYCVAIHDAVRGNGLPEYSGEQRFHPPPRTGRRQAAEANFASDVDCAAHKKWPPTIMPLPTPVPSALHKQDYRCLALSGPVYAEHDKTDIVLQYRITVADVGEYADHVHFVAISILNTDRTCLSTVSCA